MTKRKFISLIKKFFSFSWIREFRFHIYPDPKEKPLKSLAEIVFYFVLFGICLVLYVKWNEVSYNNEAVTVECLNDKVSIDGFIPKATIKVIMPMTTMPELRSDSINIFVDFNNDYRQMTDSSKISLYKWIMYNDSIRLGHNPISRRGEFSKVLSDISDLDRDEVYYSQFNVLDLNHKKNIESLKHKVDSIITCYQAESINGPCYYYKSEQTIRKPLLSLLYKPTRDTKTYCNDSLIINYFSYYNYFKNGKTLIQEGLNKGLESFHFSTSDPYHLSLGDPGWFALSDISQAYYNFHIESQTIDNISLQIYFGGATEFSELYPVPDKIRMGIIEYNDPVKLLIIRDKGLQFHVVFKELVNRQTIRVFFLTAVMSAMLTVFIAYFVLVILRWLGLKTISHLKNEEIQKAEPQKEHLD